MSVILTLLGKTWKMWVPILVVTTISGIMWYQKQRISYLEEVRDVAIAEHDRAMEEQKQLLKDIDRLNSVLATQERIDKLLGENLENAKSKLRNLENIRPDVDRWLDTPLPVGVWSAANSDSRSPGQNP